MKMAPPQTQSKAGSALLVTLLVMGLMTMMVLAFSTHVRLELRNIRNHQDQHLARANARLGLELALAQLQTAAGPDQRATATAGILGDSIPEQNRNISGIWNTTDPDAPPVWLISQPTGQSFNPTDEVSTTQSILLSALSSRDEDPTPASAIRVPFVDVHHLSPNQEGVFAYWVSDEGLKASLAPLFQADTIFNPSGMSDDEFTRLVKQRSSTSSGKPDFIPEEGLLTANAMGINLFRRNDLPLAWSNTTEEQRYVTARLKESFHHFTARTYGLLTNTVDGGFRHDLSSIQRLSPTLSSSGHSWINAAVLEGLNLWEEANSGPIRPRMIGGANQPDDPTLKIAPVISELFLGTAISGNAANPNAEEVYIYYLLFAELWNPYTLPLDFSPRGNYDDIIVRVTGLPTVELTNETRGITREINIPPLVMDLDFYDFIDGSQTNSFEPGRITWTGNPRSSGGGSATVEGQTHLRRNGVYIVSDEIGMIPGTTVEDFTGLFSAANITFEFYLKRAAFDDPSDPHVLFWTLNLNDFEEFEIQYVGGDGAPNSYEGSPSQFFRPRSTQPHGVNRASINQSRNSFNYWMRVDEELFSPGSDDFRNIVLTNALQRNTTTININDFSSSSFRNIYEVSEFPEQKVRNTTFSALDFFSGKDSPQDLNHERWAFFFDLPIRPPVELAQLNFLTFSENVFEKLGHPNPSNLNALYDRYFLSGLTSESSIALDTGMTTSNPRYRVTNTSALNDFDAWAGDLMIIGSFNVNSTSELAWAEVLTGSDLEEWPVGTSNNGSVADLQSAWFNFSDFGSQMFDRVYSGLDNYLNPLRNDGTGFQALSNFAMSNLSRETAVPPAFRQGFREISSSDRRRLGREISNRILERGSPFNSLQEFYDSGIIEDAIQAVPELNTDPSGNPIPAFSPGYFSQMTFARNMGSRLAARSHTFEIIAYGHLENPGTGERIEARCKALVQRVPKRTAQNASASLTEREFVILEFQWLD